MQIRKKRKRNGRWWHPWESGGSQETYLLSVSLQATSDLLQPGTPINNCYTGWPSGYGRPTDPLAYGQLCPETDKRPCGPSKGGCSSTNPSPPSVRAIRLTCLRASSPDINTSPSLRFWGKQGRATLASPRPPTFPTHWNSGKMASRSSVLSVGLKS